MRVLVDPLYQVVGSGVLQTDRDHSEHRAVFIVRQNSLAILEPSRDKFPRAALCFETGPSHKFLAHSHWPGF